MDWLLQKGGFDIKMPSLVKIEATNPCFHRDYIFHGYRVNYTFHEVFLSLFTLHNETMNIWSHLIAFICTLVAGMTVSLEYQAEEVGLTERLVFGMYICCACFCLGFSTLYHWFGCMSEFHYYSLLSLDLTGIAFLVGGSFFPATYYGINYSVYNITLRHNISYLYH
jgi:adiponectin receptor